MSFEQSWEDPLYLDSVEGICIHLEVGRVEDGIEMRMETRVEFGLSVDAPWISINTRSLELEAWRLVLH
jgi:hypothetical protein